MGAENSSLTDILGLLKKNAIDLMHLNALRYSILKEDRGESRMRMLTSKFK